MQAWRAFLHSILDGPLPKHVFGLIAILKRTFRKCYQTPKMKKSRFKITIVRFGPKTLNQTGTFSRSFFPI